MCVLSAFLMPNTYISTLIKIKNLLNTTYLMLFFWENDFIACYYTKAMNITSFADQLRLGLGKSFQTGILFMLDF